MAEIKTGFAPVFNGESKVLILGSFPSVKSREVKFYYGNRQNRFWKIVCGFFGEAVPDDTDSKINFLIRHNIALWDIVAECEIDGSSDAAIKNYKVADLEKVTANARLKLIILNGGKAFSIFLKHYGRIQTPHVYLPSTSPANTHCDEKLWRNTLESVFGRQ